MSREIKFKYIWSNPEKTNFITQIFTLDEIEAGNQFEVLENEPLLKDYKLIARVQFTGLLDKNGKKIFEGDIVNAQYNISSFFKKVCVYFENGCFYVDDKNPKQNLSIGYFFREKKEIEVIGNIYQNPELLGGENE